MSEGWNFILEILLSASVNYEEHKMQGCAASLNNDNDDTVLPSFFYPNSSPTICPSSPGSVSMSLPTIPTHGTSLWRVPTSLRF